MDIGLILSSPSDSSPHTIEQIDENDVSYTFSESSQDSRNNPLSKSLDIDIEPELNTPTTYRQVTKAPKKIHQGEKSLSRKLKDAILPIVLHNATDLSQTDLSMDYGSSLDLLPKISKPVPKKDPALLKEQERVLQAKKKILASRHRKPEAQNVPKPSFHKFNLVEDMQIHRNQHTPYENWVPFSRPEGHYLRLNESTLEPEDIVEYDLDLEDKAWLEAYFNNVPLEQLSDEVMAFEFTIDTLEKEWFFITRSEDAASRSVQNDINTDDIPCEICGETDCENSNAIVFCDGCDLAVHQECYGVPFIPEGQWLCRKCMLSPSNPVKCVLCPNEGGAFKQTSSNSWAHLTCALWIPEVSFGNTIYMEPVEGINKIPKSRKKLLCYLCRRQSGACIQCAFKTCSESFHVTCSKIANLCMQYKLIRGTVSMRAYCHRHTPKDYKKDIDVSALKKIEKNSNKNITKSALAHSHSFNTSKAIIPQSIYEKVLRQISKFKIRRVSDFLIESCKYWSLKKESCRGALLIKRLHLEPWTECPKALQSEEEKVAVYGVLKKVRTDLERVRMLVELVRKREACRLNILRTTHEYWEAHFFPQTRILRSVLSRMIKLDTYSVFLHPVSKEQVPDYYDYIKNPMDLGTLAKRLNEHEITTFDDFKRNLLLIYSNCQIYNSKVTQYYKIATRHAKKANEFLNSASQQISLLDLDSDTGFLPHFNHITCFSELELNNNFDSVNGTINHSDRSTNILNIINSDTDNSTPPSASPGSIVDIIGLNSSQGKARSVLDDGLSTSSDDSALESEKPVNKKSIPRKSKRFKTSSNISSTKVVSHQSTSKKPKTIQTSILNYLSKTPAKRTSRSRSLRVPDRYSP